MTDGWKSPRGSLAFGNTLLALTGFVLIMALLALGIERELQTLTAELTSRTARLMGRELSVALEEANAASLVSVDPIGRGILAQTLSRLSDDSETITGFAVHDTRGRVVLRQGPEEPGGRSGARFEDVFPGGGELPLVEQRDGAGRRDRYRVFVPLIGNGRPQGYVRVSISSRALSSVYAGTRRRIFGVLALGAVCIGVLGFVSHRRLLRQGHQLARVLEDALRGGEMPVRSPLHEFADAFRAAARVGHGALMERTSRQRVTQQMDALTNALDVGAIAIAPDGTLDMITPRARALLGLVGEEHIEERWPAMWSVIERQIADPGSDASCAIDLDCAEGGHRVLNIHRMGADLASGGYLALVRDSSATSTIREATKRPSHQFLFSELYTTMAHELKAPLQALLLNLELLEGTLHSRQREDEDKLRERQQRYLRVVREEIARLDRDLHLLLSETVADHQPAGASFDLRTLVENVAALILPQARRLGIEVGVEAPDSAITLVGERDRLKEALLAVAMNALEAMSRGGRLDFRLETLGDSVRTLVRDTGPGVSPAIVHDLAQMRFSTKEGGTGIGLAAARSAIESLGGTLHVDSTPGQGTCVAFCLPLPQPQPSDAV
jgi:signal transduction histidine kinase